ncbi:MAG: response regulator, partial [Acidobacteriota bacterium]
MSLKGRMLVVEDDLSQRELLAGFLRDLGAEVDEAGSGTEAIEKLSVSHPDFVITDVRMPHLDG